MRHIYVHVPFCRRRCSYCDFSIAVRRAVPAAAYLAAVQREHELLVAAGEWDEEPVETVYLGGGTPSLLPAAAVEDLVAYFSGGLSPRRPSSSSDASGSKERGREKVEVTVEANPDDVTREAAAVWHRAGVTRVSLGVQSFDDRVLHWMHRTHDAARAESAVRILREEGFDDISLDLIFALPDTLRSGLESNLARAVALEPGHLSLYGLSVEPRTPLARWVSRGAVRPTGAEAYAREFLHAHDVLTGAGFEHYEVSNYARPGHRSRHNSAYWTGEPYAGLGPAAHSYASGIRRWNLAQWVPYERAVGDGRRPEAEREVLTNEQRNLEAVYLGLRTCRGISRAAVAGATTVVEKALGQGWLVTDEDRLRATVAGWLRLDELAGRLTTWPEGG
jgi:oxygen-independent coproporphyrinogen-3 oxidase